MTEQIKLGQLILGDANRDAIHIAIAPVVADEKLSPGQDIGFVDYGNPEKVGHSISPVGIVDPFLKHMVFPGQRFFMFLYPNTVTSLRHHWTHPAFSEAPKPVIDQRVEDAKAWLTEFAKELNMERWDDLVDVVKDCMSTGDYFRLGFDTPDRVYSDRREFWRNYEIVTGERVDDTDDTLPFSCSC
jgi:hypothetical protein